jgi:hypothetical protein
MTDTTTVHEHTRRLPAPNDEARFAELLSSLHHFTERDPEICGPYKVDLDPILRGYTTEQLKQIQAVAMWFGHRVGA